MNKDLVKYYVFAFFGATFTSLDGGHPFKDSTLCGMSLEVDLANEIYMKIADELEIESLEGHTIPYTLLFSKPSSQIRPSKTVFPMQTIGMSGSNGFFQPFVEVQVAEEIDWISLADISNFSPGMQLYRDILSMIDGLLADMKTSGYLDELILEWN
ncbi:MAG: hypothetical protein MRY21_08305 [Simkaniaceae bacterium]|nr:hypothetical protein [Simkaniaceae bacterium]